MRSKKKVILHHIITAIKAGKNPSKISKELGLKKQTLQYYLRQLKESRQIEKQGYGIWKVLKEVKKTTKAHKIPKQIRGHAFNWKVKFKYKINWKRRLDNENIKYQLIGINKSTPRIIFNNKKIWFTKTGLVIYEPKSFYSASSFTSKGQAVWELDKTIKMLSKRLKIDLNGYLFTTSREHYGQIKNELAKQYNDKGEKLYIRDDKGIWMWIDDSHSLSELETNKPETSKRVQDWYNDMKKTNFEVTPSFLLENSNKTLQMIQSLTKEISTLKQENQFIKSKLTSGFDIKDIQPASYIN